MKNVFLCAALIVLCCGLAFGQTQYKVLWSFGGAPNDGAGPVGSLIFDRNGNLYGTTEGGGAIGAGTVFELSPNADGSWTETILYSFCSLAGCLDGTEPVAGLIFDSTGNLYGTTIAGGPNICQSAQATCGTVFELSPTSNPGGSWTETVLYNFCSDGPQGGCQDGAEPASQLTIDASGNLYGTTTTGGTAGFRNVCCWGGTVFEMSGGNGGWTHSVLYNFCANGHNDVCPDGSGPQAGVTFDSAGNLYGTTEGGGSTKYSGNGTVYKLSPGSNGWTETLLSGSNLPNEKGGNPLGEVSFDRLGNVYGTFSFGGANFDGGVFRLNSKDEKFTRFSFNGNNGQTPSAGVLLDSKNAALYGTTRIGGSNNNAGTIFQIAAPMQESVLYNFCSQPKCVDGGTPVASLIADKAGNLYGTASLGGTNGVGVVFQIVRQAPKRSAGQAALRSLLENAH
jgi:uncharacterized repeat protein (TIGR03803 family)